MSSGGNIHWCYECRRVIRPRMEDMGCPNCDGGFVQELSEIAIGRVSDRIHRLLRTMGAFNLLKFRCNHGYRLRICNTLVTSSMMRNSLMREFSILSSARIQVDSNDGLEFFVNGEYTRFRLSELIDRVLIEVQSSLLAPGPRSAIKAMLTIKITTTHIESDSQSHCPICKDQFELGTEARQTPCNHIYHSDCIIPWLVRHNTCPVCRHQLDSHS